ncbi:MAG TPA: metal-dependent transcriptional regulator [Candidatus Cloacimonadota bacterium]|nr:metal-dependent transcriptional regulator [Candidatus Cloacimonadota bacterium]
MENIELSSSLEDYLEALYHIVKSKQAARAKDLVNRLKVTAASVTGALRVLAEKGLINYAPYELITLTPYGEKIAKDVVRRHEVLKEFMVKVLTVDEKEADDAACQMEHSIPKNILERFMKFIDFVELCPRGGSKWIAGMGYQCLEQMDLKKCHACTTQILNNIENKISEGIMDTNQSVSLRNLPLGVKAKILKIQAKPELKKRFLDMGLIPESIVEIERIAPMGDPIDIRVKGYHLSLRKEDADYIFVLPME